MEGCTVHPVGEGGSQQGQREGYCLERSGYGLDGGGILTLREAGGVNAGYMEGQGSEA